MVEHEHSSELDTLSRREFLEYACKLAAVLGAQGVEDQLGAKASFAFSHRHQALALVGRYIDRMMLPADKIPPFTILSPRSFAEVYHGEVPHIPIALDVAVRLRSGTTDIELNMGNASGFHELGTADSDFPVSSGIYRSSGSALLSMVGGNQEWGALFRNTETLSVMGVGYETGNLYTHSRRLDQWGRVIVLSRDATPYSLRVADHWNPYNDALQGTNIPDRIASFSRRINEGAQTLLRLGHKPYPYVLRTIDVEGRAPVTYRKDEFVRSADTVLSGQRYIHSESPGTIIDIQHAGSVARMKLMMSGHLLAQAMAGIQEPRLLYYVGNPHTPVAIEYGVTLPRAYDQETILGLVDSIMDDGSMRMEGICQGGLSTVLPVERLSQSSFSSEDTHSNYLGKVYGDAWVRDHGALDHLTQSLTYYSGLRRATSSQLMSLTESILGGHSRVLGKDVVRQIARDGGAVPVEEDSTIRTKGIYGQIPVTATPGSVEGLYRKPTVYRPDGAWRVMRTPVFEQVLPFVFPESGTKLVLD